MTIKVRFAPSPTGNPHIGNIRTALFTYLFARKNNGIFILRIEDTDQNRQVDKGYQVIYDSLNWLGLLWDEGPILQSERLEIYKQHAKTLVDKGLAYEQEGAIYFKAKKDGQTCWIDLIGTREIKFDNATQEDFVIVRSNGWPTYHLASVVDDHAMGITHVTRGDDWISSTPKHLMLYEAFGWQVPQFAHFTTILASDRSKLSKRHGAVGILDFKKDGYLPEGLINFLALLGWTPPSGKEILSLDEMIEEFDPKDINVAPAIFNLEKLDWINGEYIRGLSDEDLTKRLQEFLIDHPASSKISPVVPLIKQRIRKLSDFIPLTDFIWEKPEYDIEVFKAVKIDNQKKALKMVVGKLENLNQPWSSEEFEKTFRSLADELSVPHKEMFQLIRVAISGQLVTPPLFETIQIIGGEEVCRRIKGVT